MLILFDYHGTGQFLLSCVLDFPLCNIKIKEKWILISVEVSLLLGVYITQNNNT